MTAADEGPQDLSVTLRPFEESDRAAVLRLTVTEAQRAYVTPIPETLENSALRRDNYVIEAEGALVGFFQIDRVAPGPALPDHLELQEVTIDARHQGKGYGRAFMAALAAFLRTGYPDWHQICLTVDFRNDPAFRLYRSAGFEDTGEITERGGGAPQRIMRKDLT